MTTAAVELWGRRIGAVTWDAERALGFFEYDPAFRRSGIELAPLVMPLADRVYSFPELDRASFHGLPGMLADVLPDKFGNALIDAWIASEGRAASDFDPVQRLCYTGRRGMGALEFRPVLGERATTSRRLDLDALVRLASQVLVDREAFATTLAEGDEPRAMRDILRVGTSAGGARAKAVIAWNPETGEVRSGQVEDGDGFSHWLLKFDGVAENRDKELADPRGFGRIEYAYHHMALACGIEMTECRLLEENGRAHFVTRRFDRTDDGHKLHLQSLCALAHLDFNQAGAHAYEQVFEVIRRLDLGMDALEQQFLRTCFNVVARNQDDHTKNVAFLMDRSGTWSLSPAFDLTYAYNPDGAWTSRHQLSLQGKRDGFEREDFARLAKLVALKRGRGLELLDRVRDAVAAWPTFAAEAGVGEAFVERIARTQRVAELGP